MSAESHDQMAMWNKKHSQGDHEQYRGAPMPFGQHAVESFAPGSSVFEIGCGTGGDSVYFAKRGHHVLATDLSSTVIDQNKQHYDRDLVEFRQLDVAKPLPFDDATFDVVYSHLSLHYFDRQTTAAIFAEICRVLMPGGVFAFACKSTDDIAYGQGEEVEKDMFVREGHIRHFFTRDYSKELLGDDYEIIELVDVTEHYATAISAMVHCIARKCASS